jgi:hypothetical protein
LAAVSVLAAEEAAVVARIQGRPLTEELRGGHRAVDVVGDVDDGGFKHVRRFGNVDSSHVGNSSDHARCAERRILLRDDEVAVPASPSDPKRVQEW